jgi:hypothetical protein
MSWSIVSTSYVLTYSILYNTYYVLYTESVEEIGLERGAADRGGDGSERGREGCGGAQARQEEGCHCARCEGPYTVRYSI